MASLFEKREAAVPTSCDQEHDGNKADEAGLSVAIPLISTEGSPGGYEVASSGNTHRLRCNSVPIQLAT